MEWKLCIALVLLAIWLYPEQILAKRTTEIDLEQNWIPQGQTNFGYSYIPRGGYRRHRFHGHGKAAPPTTTERPFIRVWNNFVRSVQPTFSLRNLTNPLVNLFNDGSANIIETPPVFVQSVGSGEEQQQFQDTEVERPQKTNKRKRKRRKQQKRRPAIESEEDLYDPYDYYGQQSQLPQAQQPMFFFDTNSGSYYGVQRFSPEDFHDQANFYNQFYYNRLQQVPNEVDERETEIEEEVYEPPTLAKLNTKKVTLLRPLPLIVRATIDKNEAVAVGGNASKDDEATTEPSESDIEASEASYSSLSESMRNALGTYMRDDHYSRQRQRHGEVAVVDSSTVTPRQRHGYFWLRAW